MDALRNAPGSVPADAFAAALAHVLTHPFGGASQLEGTMEHACADIQARSASFKVDAGVTTVVAGGAHAGEPRVEVGIPIDERRSVTFEFTREPDDDQHLRARAWAALVGLLHERQEGPSADAVHTLRRISGALGGIRNAGEASHYIVSTALRMVGGDVAWYAERTDGGLAIRADSGFEDPDFAHHWLLTAGQGVGGRVFTHGKTVVSNDYRHDSRRVKPLAELADKEGIRAVLVAPVSRGAHDSAEVVGALYLVRRQAHSFHDHDAQMLSILGEELGRALDRIDREDLLLRQVVALNEERDYWEDLRAAVRAGFDVIVVGGSLESALKTTAERSKVGFTLVESSRAEAFLAGDTSACEARKVVVAGPDDALAHVTLHHYGLADDQLVYLQESIEQMIRLHWAQTKSRFRDRRSFVARLVTRQTVAPNEVIAEGLALGIDLTRPRSVVDLATSSATNGDQIRRACDLVEELLGAQPYGVLCTRVGSGICALIECDGESSELLRDLAVMLHDSRLQQFGIVAGIGGDCRTAGDYPRAWREAQLARRVAERRTTSEVVHIDDLGVLAVFAQADVREEMIADIDRLLGPLRSLDQAMVDTLDAYLHAGLSVDEASRRLEIHPNTLRYRLKKLQERLGFDLRDGDQRFLVELGLRVRDLLRNS